MSLERSWLFIKKVISENYSTILQESMLLYSKGPTIVGSSHNLMLADSRHHHCIIIIDGTEYSSLQS